MATAKEVKAIQDSNGAISYCYCCYTATADATAADATVNGDAADAED